MKFFILLVLLISSQAQAIQFNFLGLIFNNKKIKNFGTYRSYGNGTFARSCNEYINPINGYQYGGDIGDGIYRIKPDSNPAFDVKCDMTTQGGGWTQVFKDSTLNSYNSTKNYLSQSATSFGVPTDIVYKANSSAIPHTKSMFKAVLDAPTSGFNDAYVIINKPLASITGTSDTGCFATYQFDNQGCDFYGIDFDYYSVTGGPITAAAFNPTGSGHYGYYWFGDTSLTSDSLIYTYYDTGYRYIWHQNGLALGAVHYRGSTPTTVYRSIWLK